MGKLLIIVGIILILAGLWITYSDKIPFFGKLPGDLSYEGKNVKMYFPLATCIVVSILISLILFLINKFKN